MARGDGGKMAFEDELVHGPPLKQLVKLETAVNDQGIDRCQSVRHKKGIVDLRRGDHRLTPCSAFSIPIVSVMTLGEFLRILGT